MPVHEIQVFADYHQFYLWDAGMEPAAPEDYTNDDIERMVKVAAHVVVIQPARNVTVPVRVETHDSDPGCDPGKWDHIVECSLDLPKAPNVVRLFRVTAGGFSSIANVALGSAEPVQLRVGLAGSGSNGDPTLTGFVHVLVRQ